MLTSTAIALLVAAALGAGWAWAFARWWYGRVIKSWATRSRKAERAVEGLMQKLDAERDRVEAEKRLNEALQYQVAQGRQALAEAQRATASLLAARPERPAGRRAEGSKETARLGRRSSMGRLTRG